MILTTTSFVDGKNIQEYLGLVTGISYQGIVSNAIQGMEENAKQIHADAVIGVRVVTCSIQGLDNTFQSHADVIGTAVKLKQT